MGNFIGQNGLTYLWEKIKALFDNVAFIGADDGQGIIVDGGEGEEKEDKSNKKNTITGNEASNTYYPTTKAVVDFVHQQIAQWGVVSQKQNWTMAADGGYDYTMSDLQYGWIPQANIDLFINAGATWNATSGYFELNGLTDVSYEEMMQIHKHFSLVSMESMWRGVEKLRTVLKNYGRTVPNSGNYMFMDCFDIEEIPINVYPYYPSIPMYGAFMRCSKLRNIGNILHNTTNLNLTFQGCASLESVKIQGLKLNVSFSDSPRLTIGSIIYMINNAANTPNITITLHPTAYQKAMADSRVQAALQQHTNITLASA